MKNFMKYLKIYRIYFMIVWYVEVFCVSLWFYYVIENKRVFVDIYIM